MMTVFRVLASTVGNAMILWEVLGAVAHRDTMAPDVKLM